MEQRECHLRVEMYEWKEAVDRKKLASDKLKEQLQAQTVELVQRSEVVALQQNEITKSAHNACHYRVSPHFAAQLLTMFP